MLYPCFISYLHPRDEWTLAVTKQVIGAVRNALGFYTKAPLYLDEDRLKASYNHNEILAEAICESACMVILYYPAYRDSDYCQREMLAMRAIEERRLSLLGRHLHGKRMFAPIMIRGTRQQLPDFVRDDCLALDYSRQALTAEDISSQSEVREKLFGLAEAIADVWNLLRDEPTLRAVDCQGTVMPSLLRTTAQSDILAGAPVQPFPGRG